MAPWVWITIGAAFAQTLRFMLQKTLANGVLTASGTTYARFVYSAPLVALGVWAYASITNQPIPGTNGSFWAFALAGGLSQIIATIAVVYLFSQRNFAVGITLKKTETLQTALIGFVVLGELVSIGGLAAIGLGFLGVMFLSDTGAQGMRALRRIPDRTAWIGLASGAAFGVSGVCYRGASLSLEQGDTAIRAAMTLACVTAAQTIAMTLWFLLRDKPQISRVLKSWRVSGLVGITSMIGSFLWFSAFTLQQAAYVNAVGQIELVFSILASTIFFGETIKRQEWIGMSFLGLSIFVIAAGI